MPYEIRKTGPDRWAVAKKGAVGIKKAFNKRDDAIRYMRALYKNEKDPMVIVAALEAQMLDEYADDAMTPTKFSYEERVKLAAKGVAMADGSLPIRNSAELTRALAAVDVADAAGFADDRADVVRHIHRRADAIGLSERVKHLTFGSVSDKVREAERRFPGNQRKNLKDETPRPLVDAIRRAGLTAAVFDESKHPRGQRGTHEGGRFVAVAHGTGSYTVEDRVTGETIAETRTPQEAVAIQDDANADDRAEQLVGNPSADAPGVPENEAFGYAVSPEDAAAVQKVDDKLMATNNARAKAQSELERVNTAFEEKYADGSEPSAQDLAAVQKVNDAYTEADLANYGAAQEVRRMQEAVAEKYGPAADLSVDAPGVPGIDAEKARRISGLANVGAEGGTRADGPSHMDYSPEDLRATLASPAADLTPAGRANIERTLALYDNPLTVDDFGPADPMLGEDMSQNAPGIPTAVGGFDNGVTFHQIGDQIYRAPAGSEISTVTGLPMGARWESSAAHWDEFKGVEGTVPFMATRPQLSVDASQDAPARDTINMKARSISPGDRMGAGPETTVVKKEFVTPKDANGKLSQDYANVHVTTADGVTHPIHPEQMLEVTPKSRVVGHDLSTPKGMFHTGAEAAIKHGEAQGGLHATNAKAARAALSQLENGNVIANDADYRAALDRFNKAGGTPERSQLNSQLDVVKGLAMGKLPRRNLKASADLELAGITASAAGMTPDVPPADWFVNPQFDGPTPLTVTAEGRVFGHVAPWGACHTGIQGRCVKPPPSSPGYPYFNLAGVQTTDGVVSAGKITMDTGHAPVSASSKIAASHYDNTGVVAADVAAGEDEHGIWIAGAVRPNLDVNQARALERATVSGDWRTINGHYEMVGLLAVNVPGFPIPRANVGVMASGQELALVAAGVICGCDAVDDGLDESIVVGPAVAA